MSKKRTIDSFFQAPPKKPRTEETVEVTAEETIETTNHAQYPFPIKNLPPSLASDIVSLPARPGKEINDQPDLDLLYFKPYVPPYMAKEFYEFLRSELPFYRVEYDIKRGGISTHIKTPRWTTVFGLDETSRFDQDGIVVDSKTGAKATDASYSKYPPRPIPQCLDGLRKTVESATGCKFNFCLVNYYASGSDSISYHSDDERFLGPNPAIASFSLGARRDFLMKHKPVPSQEQTDGVSESKPLKLQLASGEMVLMRGSTQSKWLHSIPKRTGKNQDDGGRINITFRRAVIKEGTNNYYNYNVGSGPVYRWNAKTHEMTIWQS